MVKDEEWRESEKMIKGRREQKNDDRRKGNEKKDGNKRMIKER